MDILFGDEKTLKLVLILNFVLISNQNIIDSISLGITYIAEEANMDTQKQDCIMMKTLN